LIVHSDQGVQYASKAYRRLINTHDFVGSMSKKGCCWDNGVPRRHVAERLPHCHAA